MWILKSTYLFSFIKKTREKISPQLVKVRDFLSILIIKISACICCRSHSLVSCISVCNDVLESQL